MLRISILFIIFSATWGVSFDNNSYSEELILCISVADEEVNITDARGSCLEGEVQTVFSEFDAGERDSVVPLANFKSNKDCETKGNRVELGFDKDDDGVLDPEEIVLISEKCETSSEGE